MMDTEDVLCWLFFSLAWTHVYIFFPFPISYVLYFVAVFLIVLDWVCSTYLDLEWVNEWEWDLMGREWKGLNLDVEKKEKKLDSQKIQLMMMMEGKRFLWGVHFGIYYIICGTDRVERLCVVEEGSRTDSSNVQACEEDENIGLEWKMFMATDSSSLAFVTFQLNGLWDERWKIQYWELNWI